MKKVLLVLFLMVPVLKAAAQQVYIETGTVASSFDYKNSEGKSLESLYGGSHLLLKAGYRVITGINRLNFSTGIRYSGYMAKGCEVALGNYFEWETRYLGLDLGLDYNVFVSSPSRSSQNDFTGYLKVTASPEFMVMGTQVINKQVYNLMGTEQFKFPFIFGRGGAGLRYSFNSTEVYGEYMIGYGFPVMKDKNDKESLKIFNQNFSFGLIINLPSYRSW